MNKTEQSFMNHFRTRFLRVFLSLTFQVETQINEELGKRLQPQTLSFWHQVSQNLSVGEDII